MASTASAGPRRRLSKDARRAKLLAAAEEIFGEVGYTGATMELVAARAGVARSLLYEHFTSLEDIYVDCVRAARATYEAELLRHINPDASPREQLQAGGESFFTTLENNPVRWQLLFGSNAILPGQANEKLAALRFATIEQIRLLLKAAAPDAPPERIEACAHVISGAGERLGHWWLTRPDIPRARIVSHYVDILWNGLQPYIKDDERDRSPH